MVGSKTLSRSAFLEVSQERVPGGIPGTCSLGVSRNAKFKNEKLSKTSLNGEKQIFRLFFVRGGTV